MQPSCISASVSCVSRFFTGTTDFVPVVVGSKCPDCDDQPLVLHEAEDTKARSLPSSERDIFLLRVSGITLQVSVCAHEPERIEGRGRFVSVTEYDKLREGAKTMASPASTCLVCVCLVCVCVYVCAHIY